MGRGPKFIILRGPSGAGKSTVAKHLHVQSKRKVVLIEQDYYREQILNGNEGTKKASKVMRLEMFETDICIALKHGFDVIVEGILNPETYIPVFENIRKDHPNENYMFYFDISLDETFRRHANRSKSTRFGTDEMKEWYKFAKHSGLEWEVIIPEESSIDETVTDIKVITGL
ncbi:MAG: AAA family ATPase [Candidatus Saccharimonadales bacterium]